jgi:capsular polysaccharide biosynthesis protein
MSQQALDLRRSMHIVRRHKILVGVVTLLGILAGAAYAFVHPPLVSSTALVVLPQSAQSTQASAAAALNGTPDSFTATQVVIAGSNAVLTGALPGVRPAMSLDQVRRDVGASSLTSYIVAITAKGKTAGDAEATANAVAQSYISYVSAASSPIGSVPARMLESAESATGPSPLESLLISALIGGLAGGAIGIVVALAAGRKDKRLWGRDEIANSLGVPVLASVPVGRPSDASSWVRLMDDYKPAYVHAWQLRKAMQQLGVTAASIGGGNSSLTVLSMSSDPAALALGPQLAAFAASLGIPTALVIGPQQDANTTAALRTACAVPSSVSARRPSHLRVMAMDSSEVNEEPDAELTVVVVVVDGSTPQMPDTMRTSVTVIGVSAGSATAEQLSCVAGVAATDRRDIAGILVADPEPDDQTTGRLPSLTASAQPRRPRRLSNMTTEIRR